MLVGWPGGGRAVRSREVRKRGRAASSVCITGELMAFGEKCFIYPIPVSLGGYLFHYSWLKYQHRIVVNVLIGHPDKADGQVM